MAPKTAPKADTPHKEKRSAASTPMPPKKKQQLTPDMVKLSAFIDRHKTMDIKIVPCKKDGRLTGNYAAEIKLPLALSTELEAADIAMRVESGIFLDAMRFVKAKSIYVLKIFYKNQLELLAKHASKTIAEMIRACADKIDMSKIKLKEIRLVEVALTGNECGGFRATSDGDDLTAGSTELILYGNTYCFQNYARANGWTWQSNYLGVRGFECWLNKSADHDDVAAYLIDTFEIDDLFIAECTSDIAAKLM